MGRYYDGDISGKFWFGVQESTAPENLGAYPIKITYCWSDEKALEDRLMEMEKLLGDNLKKMDEFFDANSAYTDKELAEHLGVGEDKAGELLKIYADICLGRKVKKHLNSGNGCCIIDCDLQ